MANVTSEKLYDFSDFDGTGRHRKKSDTKTTLLSHYAFADWGYDEDGRRIAQLVGGVSKKLRYAYPLISTAIKNAATGTETLIWIHFDLDYKRAEKKWRKNGMLDWPTIAALLQKELPDFLKYLTRITRSSGGKGLSLALAISPLELIEETASVQKMAYMLQAQLIHILNSFGLGADEGARGLKRLMPNVFQPDQIVDCDEITEALIQSRRPRVIQTLLFAIRFHASLRPISKKDRVDILWSDKRVEGACARLYLDLLDTVGPWGSQQYTCKELIAQYGISKNTVTKFLAEAPSWLRTQKIEGEGYRLTLIASKSLTERAFALLEASHAHSNKGTFPAFHCALISGPELVAPGTRNQWLVSVALACKWKGIDREEALKALQIAVKLVPTFRESRSLGRELSSIVGSIYKHRTEAFGSAVDAVLPEWLENILLNNKPKSSSQTFAKKGTYVVGSQVLACGAVSECLAPSSSAQSFQASGQDCRLMPLREMEHSLLGAKAQITGKSLDMVSSKEENPSPFEGGSGDLPPIKALESLETKTFRREGDLEILRCLVPSLACMIELASEMNSNKVLVEAAPKASPEKEVKVKPAPRLALKELRRQNFKEVHPLDRIARAFDRCMTRSSGRGILKVLRKEEPRIEKIERHAIGLYSPPEGSFKRLLCAYSVASRELRREFLEVLIGAE